MKVEGVTHTQDLTFEMNIFSCCSGIDQVKKRYNYPQIILCNHHNAEFPALEQPHSQTPGSVGCNSRQFAVLAQHDKFKPSLYLLPKNLILIWIHSGVGMLPGGEHSWKSTVHKAGAFSLLLDESSGRMMSRVCRKVGEG